MERAFFENGRFENLIARNNTVKFGDYERCSFRNCDFSDSDLSGINFTDCIFDGCNFTLVKLLQTTFRDAKFINSKLLGLHFEDCNTLMVSFEFYGCNISLCSFYNMKLKKTVFSYSLITECDFSKADMSLSEFRDCDLLLSTFSNTNLEKADLRTAVNYSIDPDRNRLRKAKFSLQGLPGLLEKYDLNIDGMTV